MSPSARPASPASPASPAWPFAARAALPVLAALVAACGDAGARSPGIGPGGGGRDSVAIGIALNPQRPGMQSIYNGADLAVEVLNAEGALRGARPFTARRTPPTVTSAVEVATLLRDDPAVLGVVGHPESGTTLDAMPVYSDAEHDGANAVVAISPTATSPALSGTSRWLFRVTPSDVAISRAVAHYVADTLKALRAAVIYRNDAYGRDWTAAFIAAYRERGGTVVQRDPYVAGVTEWAAYAEYLKQTRPAVLLFPGSAEDAELALRAMRAAGTAVPFVGGDATAALAHKPEFAGARFVSMFVAERATSDEARAFVEAYQRRFAEVPDPRAAMAYDATLLIGRAVLALGGRATRSAVRDYIEGVGTRSDSVRGVAGAIAFDVRHDVVGRQVVIAEVPGVRAAAAGAAK
jgi:branched-chain amino acid transport system substrate-binding protein